MNTEEVASKLVELCRKGDFRGAMESLYAKDIVSVEAQQMENMPAEMRGIDQVRGKTDWWEKNMEVHSAKVEGPFVARDTFVVQFDIDATDKSSEGANADVRSRNLHRQRWQGGAGGISAACSEKRIGTGKRANSIASLLACESGHRKGGTRALLCKAQSPVSCHTGTLSRSDKVMRAEIGRRALMERLSIVL